ncbi:MAG TPA: hypothetical protein VH723_01650 [Candidatus Limnocylindrales bacterium]
MRIVVVDRRRVVLACAAALVVSLLPTVPVVGAQPVPDGMSHTERARVLAGMTPAERAVFEDRFPAARYLLVGHARTTRAVDGATGRPVDAPRSLATGEVAGPGPSGIQNLTIKATLVFDRYLPCCHWDIYNTFDWTGVPPHGGAGKDQVATAWANGGAVRSPGAWGFYSDEGYIAFNLQDVAPNAGFNFEFDECQILCGDGYADWGYVIGTIWQTRRQYRATNMVFKYFHTYSNIEYGLAINGVGPSITIAPTTGVQATAALVTFIN